MPPEPVVSTYVIPEPYDRAVRRLRQALSGRGLSISSELDLAERIQRELGIGVGPSCIFYVDSPGLLLEAITLFPPAAALLPLHIVVAAQGNQTEVHLLSPSHPYLTAIPALVRAPITRLQTELTGALQKIAMRQGVCRAEG